jgi:hypothetical protein
MNAYLAKRKRDKEMEQNESDLLNRTFTQQFSSVFDDTYIDGKRQPAPVFSFKGLISKQVSH